ncbi:ATP-dependent DNA helicase DinG [Sanguibacter gelidistatuariae]|uniref:ATP-dependent helicase DinG n=1 Tax=Sanguibacter gelidistatuariae TaxID=1814289 RepID=A0A1G6NW25_9MICO|nr:ATP-dependent DNA helicase [Sanguibacter gelidistatuariae]SDC71457.1 ATP-dependent DNA helicase DinG [Sanguibacter gelidistatuariae]
MSDAETPDRAGDDAPGAADVHRLLDLAVGALGGARRDGQHDMTEAVATAMRTKEHLLVQAGTGTGKSLGYLVPAVHHAVTTDERVIVSTATLALQRQIMTRDLPLVAQTLAPYLPRRPQLALLKGWHNYACLHKIAGGYPPDDAGTLFDMPRTEGPTEPLTAAGPGAPSADADGAAGLGKQILRLREWASDTETGDRDDMVPGVSDRAWRQVSVTSLECLGQKCPLIDDCFPERARGIAREADVVVTNHAMLGIAATGSPGVLPEHSVVIADEAHELSDRVTAAATAELSVASIEHASRQARRHGGIPTTDLDAAAADFGSVLAGLPAERFPDGLPEGARLSVAGVRDAARAVLSALKPEPGKGPGSDAGSASSGLKMASSSMLLVFETAERMAADHSGFDVLWCSRGGDGGFGAGMSKLHAAPLGVAGLIRSNLWEEKVGILTSATLALGESFDPIARAVGLERAASEDDEDPAKAGQAAKASLAWRGLDVGSPFDYPRQGILYIAKRLPTPGQQATTDDQVEEMVALMKAAGGRTLGLFSSRRAAERAAELVRELVDFPVLCQGDDQLPTLVRAFAADDATCLFGTLSLWQGVDVPGSACQLVMIDRIPFPRPDDPVKAARARYIESHGGNGFMQVSATHAALLLAQGAGRLVRTTTDRGVVAVLDPRLATARYASYLVNSLPDFWQTTDRHVAVSALERLAALG